MFDHVVTEVFPDGSVTVTLPDAETRAAMLATGMAGGMEDSCARLDRLLPA